MTVIEVIQKSTDFLARKGIASPRLQIELILAHILAMPRMKLYMNFDRQLSEPEVARARQMTLERSNRKPLQHILGLAPFYGSEFQVNPHVLIPRPETELLVEESIRLLQPFADTGAPLVALDYGTGSGCIAISLVKEVSKLSLTAIDKSPEALGVALANAARIGVQDQISFIESTELPRTVASHSVHLFVSNPPYIPTEELASLEPEVKDHDPQLALDGGMDGLDFYRKFALSVPRILVGGGSLAVEFGDGQGGAIQKIFDLGDWANPRILKDLSGRERVFTAQKTT